MASQTGARLIDGSNKILTSLSETATSQACVGRGGEGKEKDVLGAGEKASMGDTNVWVCMCE